MKRIRSLLIAAVALAGLTLVAAPSANAGAQVSISFGSGGYYGNPYYYQTRPYYGRPAYPNYGYGNRPGYYNRGPVYRQPAYRAPVYRSQTGYYNHR